MNDFKFSVDHQYRDKSNPSNIDDEFTRVLSLGTGGGIRYKVYSNIKELSTLPAFVVIESSYKNSGYDDLFDSMNGVLNYWGDSKANSKYIAKGLHAFHGNKILKKVKDLLDENQRSLIPPFLYFKRPKKGIVEFKGLLILSSIKKVENFLSEDENGDQKKIENYFCNFDVLNENIVSTNWLMERANAINLSQRDHLAPDQWKNYMKGLSKRTIYV